MFHQVFKLLELGKKKLGCALLFQPTSRGLDILMKHSFSCLIYYIKTQQTCIVMQAEIVNSKKKFDCMTSEFHVKFHEKTNIVRNATYMQAVIAVAICTFACGSPCLVPRRPSLLYGGARALCILPITPHAPCLPALYRRLGTRHLKSPHHISVELSTHLNMCYTNYFHYYFVSPKKASYKYKTVQIRI